jgi:biopolymer transport protein TolR
MKYRYRRKLERKWRSQLSEVSLTPLIDTALTLLIIFMLTAPIMHTSLQVSLPSVKSGNTENQRDDIIVRIDRQGTIELNNTVCTLEHFHELLVPLLQENGPKGVVVHADKGIEYGSVVQVVDHIAMIEGVSYVALGSEQVS